MKTIIHPVVEFKPLDNKYRAGVDLERNGVFSCPGLDFFFDTHEAALAEAIDLADYYMAGCDDTGDDAEIGELRTNVKEQ